MEGFLGLAAGSAAANAFNIFSYNRDAWTTDVQMVLSRRIQKQSLLLAQVGMFREDVIELVGATVTVLKNFALITTLVLGFSASAWLSVTWSDTAGKPDEFVHAAFTVSVGSSFLYLVLAVLCMIAASHMAVSCQQEMLTSLVRLPVEYCDDELNQAAEGETIEAFENHNAGRLLRVPFLSRLGGRPEDGGLAEGMDTPASRVMSIEFMRRQRRRFLRLFKREEAQWNVLARYSVVFGVLGLGNLLEAYGYFSAQGLLVDEEAREKMFWSTWIVQFLMTMVDVLMRWAFSTFIGCPFTVRVLEAIMALGGPGCTAIALRVEPFGLPDAIRKVCVPLCFVCHVIMTCIAMYYIEASFHMAMEQGLAGISPTSAPAELYPESNSETETEEEDLIAAPKDRTSRARSSRPRDLRDACFHASTPPCRMACFSALPVLVAWILCLCWASYRAMYPGEGEPLLILEAPLEASLQAAALGLGVQATPANFTSAPRAELEAADRRSLRGAEPEAAELGARLEEELAWELQRTASLQARLAALREERARRRSELASLAGDLEGLLRRRPAEAGELSACAGGRGAGRSAGEAAPAAGLPF